jgi:hypothetical protein
MIVELHGKLIHIFIEEVFLLLGGSSQKSRHLKLSIMVQYWMQITPSTSTGPFFYKLRITAN